MDQFFDSLEIWLQNKFRFAVSWINSNVYLYFRWIEIFVIIIMLFYMYKILKLFYKDYKEDEENDEKFLLSILRLPQFNLIIYNLEIDTIKCGLEIFIIMIISKFINFYKINLISLLFHKYISISFIVIGIYYVVKCKLLNRELDECKIGVLNFIHDYILLILLSSVLYGIKFIILNLLGVYCLTLIKSYLELKMKSDSDKEAKPELYKIREGQLIDFHEILNKKYDENFAVAINGEWGTGKTVFLESYMNKYKKEHIYIYIKPMITDNLVSLIEQIRKQLSNIMISYSINSGGRKLVKKYFDEIIKVVGEKSKVSFNELFEINQYKDTHMNLKDKIQSNINALNKKTKKKIIFIIDDFDRINQDNQEVILDFIKEIVNFKNSITVFAFDNNKLNENKKINHEYMEKFVSEERDLAKISYEEIIKYHLNRISCDSENKIMSYLVVEVEKIILLEDKRILGIYLSLLDEKKSKNKKPTSMEDEIYKEILNSKVERWCFLQKQMDNSRRVISFLDNINQTISILDRKKNNYKLNIDRIKELDLPRIIYAMNFLKVFDNNVFMEIIQRGNFTNYTRLLDSNCRHGELFSNNKSENIISYTDEQKKSEVSYWYLNEVFNGLEVFDYNLEDKLMINREKIIRDLFIDYSLENSEILYNDNKARNMLEELDSNNKEIFTDKEEMNKQIDLIVDLILNSDEEEKKEERFKIFAENCIRAIKSKSLKLDSYIGIIASNRFAGIRKYGRVFLEVLNDNIDENFKMSVSEKYHIDELIKDISTDLTYDNISVISTYLAILGNKDKDNISRYLRTFNSMKQLLEMINSILKKLKIEEIASYNELLSKISPKAREVCKNDKINIDYLDGRLKKFVEDINSLDEISDQLTKKSKISFKEIEINQMDGHQIIESIKEIENESIDKENALRFLKLLARLKYYWENNIIEVDCSEKSNLISMCETILNNIEEKDLLDTMECISISLNIECLKNIKEQEESE